MMSRDFDYERIGNSYAILLSQLRCHVTPFEYRMLLQTQRAADLWVRRRSFPGPFEEIWLAESARRIEEGFESLRSGRRRRDCVRSLLHLLQDLVLASDGDREGRTRSFP